MLRVLCRGSVLAAGLAIGLAGCEGGGGDVGSGMPEKNAGYVPPSAPPGAPPVSADMTSVGNKPAAKKASPAPADSGSKDTAK